MGDSGLPTNTLPSKPPSTPGVVREMRPKGLGRAGEQFTVSWRAMSAQGGRCKAKNILPRVFSTLDQTKRIYLLVSQTWLQILQRGSA